MLTQRAGSQGPLNLLLIVDCYLPSEKSAARLIADLSHEFVRRGHHATVLVPSDSVSHFNITEEVPGIQVLRYRAGKTKDVHYALRAINEMSLSLTAWLRCRRWLLDHPHDLIVYYSPSIFFGPLVRWLRGRWKVPSFLVLRDIFPDWAVDTGILKKGLLYRVFKRFERMQYRAASVIGVETDGSVRYFAGTEHEHKVQVVRNWTVATPPPAASSTFREGLGLAGKVIFFYGGNIGIAQDMDNLLRLAKRMREHPEAHFLLVGSGNRVPHLKEQIASEQIDNVSVLPAVDQDTYLAMLNEFDVGLITLDRRLKSSNYPGKLLGYLQCRKPVLASINPGNDLADLLEKSGVGLVSVNGEDDLLYKNAVLLCRGELRQEMGSAAEKLLQSVFSVERVADQMLQVLGTGPPLESDRGKR